MPIVSLPNGTDLDFPDGMSEDDMRNAIHSNFPEYAPKQSLTSRAVDMAKSGLGWLAEKAQESANESDRIGKDRYAKLTQPKPLDIQSAEPVSSTRLNSPTLDRLTGRNRLLEEVDADGEQAAAEVAPVIVNKGKATGWVERNKLQEVAEVESARDAARAGIVKRVDASAKSIDGYGDAPGARTIGETYKDSGAQLIEGAANIAKAPVGLFAPESRLYESLDASSKFWFDQQSDEIKQRVAQADAHVKALSDAGMWEELKAAVSEYATDPSLAARFVVSNIASVIPSVGAVKLAQLAAIAKGASAAKAASVGLMAGSATNAVLNGGGARGESFEQIRDAYIKQGMDGGQATEQALIDSRAAGAVGAGVGLLTGRTGIEKALTGGTAGKGAVSAGMKSFAAEAGGEQIEELAPQLASNLQLSGIDGRDPSKGLATTAVQTAIGAGPTSAMSGAITAHDVSAANNESALRDSMAANTEAIRALDQNGTLAVDGSTVVPAVNPYSPTLTRAAQAAALSGATPAPPTDAGLLEQLRGKVEPEIDTGVLAASDLIAEEENAQQPTEPIPVQQAQRQDEKPNSELPVQAMQDGIEAGAAAIAPGIAQAQEQAAGDVGQGVGNGKTRQEAPALVTGSRGGATNLGTQSVPDAVAQPASAGMDAPAGGIAPGSGSNLPAGNAIDGGRDAVAPTMLPKSVSGTPPIVHKSGKPFKTKGDARLALDTKHKELKGTHHVVNMGDGFAIAEKPAPDSPVAQPVESPAQVKKSIQLTKEAATRIARQFTAQDMPTYVVPHPTAAGMYAVSDTPATAEESSAVQPGATDTLAATEPVSKSQQKRLDAQKAKSELQGQADIFNRQSANQPTQQEPNATPSQPRPEGAQPAPAMAGQGQTATPDESTAIAHLEAAGVTGQNYLDAISRYKSGQVGLGDLENAYPVKSAASAISSNQSGTTQGVTQERAVRADGDGVRADGRMESEGVSEEEAIDRAGSVIYQLADAGKVIEGKETAESLPKQAGNEKIEDFGEKISGARKEYAAAYKDRMAEAMKSDVFAQPLSKSWPEPDYQKLVDSGYDKNIVGLVRSMRDEIPNKPGKEWKQKTWAKQVELLRDTADKLLNDSEFSDKFVSRMKSEEHLKLEDAINGRAEMYAMLGHEKSLKGIRISRSLYGVYNGVPYSPKKIIWEVIKDAKATIFGNMPTTLGSGDTRQAAIDSFAKAYSTLDTGKEKSADTKFELYADRYAKDDSKGQYFIGKKVGRNVIHIKDGFYTVKEARAYIAEHNEELTAILEQKKAVPRERYDTNQPRVGQDMRHAQDVTPEMFTEAFSFRGVQFGNYVEGARRQKDLNDAYDALMDLSAVLGIPPKALSLNGELGLAFGARGTGGKNPHSAHYESGKIVINLTKGNGAGSLAHEWWHSLDNYFSRLRGKGDGFATDGLDVSLAARGADYHFKDDGIRKEMIDAFGAVVKAINQTAIKQRSRSLDNRRTKEYWGTGIEMSARSFERYVIAKLHDSGFANDYLANVVSEEYWNAAEALGIGEGGSYPYPTESELPAIRAGFDKFFQTIEAKETDQGTALFSRSSDNGGALPESEWLSEAAIAQVVEERLAQFGHQAPIIIRNSESDVLGNAGIETANDGVVSSGMTYKGNVYLFRDGLRDTAAVSRTIWHELVHYGLRRFLTKEQYIASMQNLYLNDAWVRGRADEWVKSKDGADAAAKDGNAYARARGVDEALARLAETSEGEYRNNGLLAKTYRTLARWMAKLAGKFGFHESATRWNGVTNDESRDLVRAMFRKLRNDEPATSSDWAFTSDPAFMTAWHGSPHDHDKFDSSKIVTGEGAQYLPIPKIQAIVDAAIAKMPRLAGSVHIVQSTSDLPGGGLYSDIEGAYHSSGSVYLVADNLHTEFRARKVLAHEAVGHLAMEEMLNTVDPKLWDRLVNQVNTLEIGGNKLIKSLAAQVDESQPGLSKKTRVKEILALMAEDDVQNDPRFVGAPRSTFQRFIDGIKAFMKLVFDVQMTDKEVIEIVKLAERHLGEKRGASSVVAGMKQAMASRSAHKIRSTGFDKSNGTVVSDFKNDTPMKSHVDYKAAKSGDVSAAARLVQDLVKPSSIAAAKAEFGSDVIYVPVHAEEASGMNQIPNMLAMLYSDRTGGEVGGGILQANRAYHTGANAMERLMARSEFSGDVEAVRRYVLVDDVTTMGSTLADMASHIRSQGGEVAGSVVLVNAARSGMMIPSSKTIKELEARHGDEIRNLFGIEPSALTASESQYLLGFRTTDELRNRVAKAKSERSARLRAKGILSERQDSSSLENTESGSFYSRKTPSVQPALTGVGNIRKQPIPQQPSLGLTGGASGNRASWDAPEASKLDSFIYQIQNKHIDMKRVKDSIEKSFGAVADKWNPYLKEELFHERAASRVKSFVEGELTPMLEVMAKEKISQGDLGQYLWARHAKEANAYIATINSKLPDGGSGMTNQAADDYMANLDPAMKQKLEGLAQQIDAINHKTRLTLVNYGLISPNDVTTWENTYKHYIPLNREDMDHLGHGNGMGQGFSIKGHETKRRTGSELAVAVGEVLGNIAMQRERAITRGEKNRVGLALFGMAKLHPNPDFWVTDKAPTMKVVQNINGQDQVVEMVDHLYKSKDNVVVVKIPNTRTGKVEEHAIVFDLRNERAVRMAGAIKNLEGVQLGEVMSATAKVTRYFASINTQFNPIFGILNLTRDMQTAALNLSNTQLAGKQLSILNDTRSILAGAMKHGMRGFDGQWATLSEEFHAEGGATGYRDVFATGKERAEALQKALDPDWWTKTAWGKKITLNGYIEFPMVMAMDKGLRPVLNWLSDYNETMENAVRLAAYKEAKAMGLSKEQSASIAKNLTVNFNRKGEKAMQIGAMYAFFNAAVQGMTRDGSTLRGPAGKRIILGGMLIGAVQALALAFAGFGDDEPPEFVKERNLIFPIGGGKYLTLPMPLTFNVLPNLGRITTELMLSGGKKAGDKAVNMLGILLDASNPLGGSSPALQIALPTVIDPLGALAQNKDWTGKPIYREDFSGLHPTPGFARSKDTSSMPSRWLAEGINSMTGGDKYAAGKLSPTPDQLDFLIGQVTGGVGRELSKVATTATIMFTGEDLPAHKVPLLGRFYGDTTGQSSQGARFYDNLKRINEIKAGLDGRIKDKQPTAQFKQDNPEYKMIGEAVSAEREVSDFRSRKRKLMEKGNNKADIKLIDARITSVMKSINDRVESQP